MIGKKEYVIDAAQFTTGMATSDYSQDGGFGPSTNGINLTVNPGVLRSMASEVDISTNVAGNIIASCEDGQTVASLDRLFVDSSANFYTLSGSTITKRHTGAKIYTAGTTDMVSFAGNTYVTSTTDIALWNTSAFTLTESWWVTTKGKSAFGAANRHPLLVFEGYLWVADGNALWFIDSAGTITAAPWTLSSNELIVALAIDPYSGRMLVSVVTLQNYSDSFSGKSFVYMYDGYSSKPVRKVPVDEMISAFYNVGGNVYCGFGANLGLWNGNGLTFLRKLVNVTKTGAELPYKHHFANIDNTLLVVDGLNILAYGEVTQGGRKVFYYPYKNSVNSSKLSAICYIGSSKVAIAYSSAKLSTIDFSSTSSGIGIFYGSVVQFPRPVFVHRVRIITDGITTTAGLGGMGLYDETLTLRQPTVSTFKVAAASTPQYVFDFDYGGLKLQMMQPRIGFDTQGFGVVRIVIYYDIAE